MLFESFRTKQQACNKKVRRNYEERDRKGIVVLYLYCPDTNQCVYTTGSAARNAAADSLTVTAFSGKQVQTYIGFISADGLEIANSIFTGEVTVS